MLLIFIAAFFDAASAIAIEIPSSPPSNARSQLASAPVGVSLEFFTFPDYIDDVPSTLTCLENLKDLTGTWPPLRIGGTTQDRATYDASSSEAVSYTVADPSDAPDELTFGPSFFSLASEYSGNVIVGLNRRLDNFDNTLAAATAARDAMTNLDAIELGNEPSLYTDSDPIARGESWTASSDYQSQVEWQQNLCGNLSTSGLISAGVYLGTSPMSVAGLSEKEGASGANVKDFCSHNYPQSQSTADLALLMNHTYIASQIQPFAAEISASTALGKPHIFGETNSATQGGGGISPTYGAGLWLLDYVMQTMVLGTRALYFHQGTIGNCQYCWWGRYSMGAPYFGAYFATMALAGADQIAALDDQTTAYAAYALYSDGKPIKILLYNSDYYTSGTRSSQSITLTGIASSTLTAKRLTAASATARVDQGQSPTIAGQTFEDGTCAIQGEAQDESVAVFNGQAVVEVGASEALLIML